MNSKEKIHIAQIEFIKNNQGWLFNYEDLATKFQTEKVEQKPDQQLNEKLAKCSILISTASAVEQRILTCKLYDEMNSGSGSKRLEEISVDGCVYQFAQIEGVGVVHVYPNRILPVSSDRVLHTVERALEHFRPKLVVSLGTAFGIDCEKQPLGTVLFSREIIPYDAFHKTINGRLKLRSKDIIDTHEALMLGRYCLRNEKIDIESGIARENLAGESVDFKWQYGTMLSGVSGKNNVDSSKKLLRALKKMKGEDLIGIETEDACIYRKCVKIGIPCIAIKGVCGWGVKKKRWLDVLWYAAIDKSKIPASDDPNTLTEECIEAYAMDNASEALFRLIRSDSEFLTAFSADYCGYTLKACSSTKRFRGWRERLISMIRKILWASCIAFLFVLEIAILWMYSEGAWDQQSLCLDTGEKIVFLAITEIIFCLILLVFANRRPTPLRKKYECVDLWLKEINCEEGYVSFKGSNFQAASHVIVTCWIADGGEKIEVDFAENVNLAVNKIALKMPKEFDNKTILQVDYELLNGTHYAHLFVGKRNRGRLSKKYRLPIVCNEYVYRAEDKKDIYLFKRNLAPEKYVSESKNSGPD